MVRIWFARLLVLASLLSLPLAAQNVYPRWASSPGPIQSTTSPATCTNGDQLIRTDQPAGSNLYLCDSINTWHAIAGTGSSSGTYTPLNGFTRSIESKLQEYYSVTDYGAVPDGIMRTDGAMNAGSAVLTSASGSFSSGDVGKYIQVIGAGPGGTTHSDGAMTSGSAVLTSASSSFVGLDVGRGIVVLGAGPGGSNLITTINGVNSGTSVTLSATASTSVTAKQFYYGYMTLEGTISSYQGATQVTLSGAAAGTITGATYAYGTDSHIAIQAAIDRVGALGGGIVRLPTPANCPTGAICGYVAKATDQMTAHVPGAIKIRYNNVSLMGDPNMTNIFCRGAWSNYTNPVMGAGLTEEIRGNCINIGDDGGGLGAAGDNVQNVTVQYLRLYGMTNGLTYNTSFDPTKDPLTTTGDGWDETHKGIYIWGGAGQMNITIANVHAQDFKGETIYGGGGATSITLRDSVITNSNSSCVSISVNNFKMLYNTVTNCANAGVENGTMSSTTAPAFENVRHLYQGNIFRNIPSEAIVLVGVDAGINRGVLEVVDNYFDTIGVVHPSASQVAVYIVAQNNGSNQPPSHVIIDRNVCHDCQSFVNIQTTGHVEVKDNSFIVDNYGLYNFMSFMQAMKDVVVANNTGSITANAIANNHSMYTVYEMDPGYVSGSGTWNRLVIKNNVWDFTGSPAPPTWFQFVTSSAQGYNFANAKFPVWGGDICYGCVEVDDYGVQNLSGTTVIQPVGPVNTVNRQPSAVTVTVSTAKAEDGTEIKIVNAGGFALTFANDANMQLNSSVTVPVNGIITLRYEAVIGKFVLR